MPGSMHAIVLLGLLALGACRSAEPHGANVCPYDLSFVRSRLVTPTDVQAAFLGADTVEQQLSEPIDEMIRRGGGIEPSIATGERYVQEYQATLADKDAVRAQFHAEGQTEQCIDTYLLTVQDGVTINQAFVDSVRCRVEQADDPVVPSNVRS